MNIKGVIKEKGYTIEQVALKMGVTRVSLTQSLSKNPTISTLQRVADSIGCKVVDFFVDELESTTITPDFKCPHCGGSLDIQIQKKDVE